MTGKLLFSTIEVTRQVFYKCPQSFAMVNLKPLVPGHVLVVPSRVVPRINDLNDVELSSLMSSIRRVGNVVERAYGADGLTIACQDGKSAGQSIPHVHFHILPRKAKGDQFSNNDDIYPALEKSEGEMPYHIEHQPLRVDADEDRLPRTIDEMETEAQWLSTFFEES